MPTAYRRRSPESAPPASSRGLAYHARVTAPSTPVPPPIPRERGWPLWQRIGFRYLMLHWLLYALPQPFARLVFTAGYWLRELQEKINADAGDGEEIDLTSWLTDVYWFIGQFHAQWQELTTWVATKSTDLGFPLEVVHQRTGSGDTMHDFVQLGCVAVAAASLTAVWSLLDWRRGGHPVLGRWVHLGARWWLAFWLLSYGVIKLYAGQFAEPGISGLTREIGDKSPMGMVWTFIGASKPYEVFGGICEILGGLLLFHNRTALLGCIVTIATMTNVCALNWLYDVPVKLFSTHLLLAAVFLMAPWAGRLWALTVGNAPSQPVRMAVFRRWWLAWPLAIFGWLWVGGTLAQAHFQNMEIMADREESYGKPALYGLWKVEKMILDGTEVPMSDSSRWEFFAIDRGNRAWARELVGKVHSWQYAEDLDANTITLSGSGVISGLLGGRTWTIERGKKTVKVPHPAPTKMSEYNAEVDGERDSIVFRGRWGSRDLELHTVKKEFRIFRGFHWVQELPFNK